MTAVGDLCGLREILAGMHYKASDVLRADGIVRVEGPSDRIYVRRRLQLPDPALREGVRHTVMFYGGRPMVPHLSCGDDRAADLIRVVTVNCNFVLPTDRGGDSSAPRRAAAEPRLTEEAGPGRCRETNGKEVENYLSASAPGRSLSHRFEVPVDCPVSRFESAGEAIEAATKGLPGRRVNCKDNKTESARETAPFLEEVGLDVFDLRGRIAGVAESIRRCNHSPLAGQAPAVGPIGAAASATGTPGASEIPRTVSR